MFALCQMLGWIFNLYECSFIRECMLHPVFSMFLLQLIRMLVQLHVLPRIAASAHATPSLFYSLSSRNLHVAPSPHSLSLQSCFHHQWIFLSSQLCSASMLSTTFLFHSLHLLHSLHSVCCLQLLFMMLLVVMLLFSYIDVLVCKQLDIFVRTQAHRNFINCISRCSLDDVFNFALLEIIVPTLLRSR